MPGHCEQLLSFKVRCKHSEQEMKIFVYPSVNISENFTSTLAGRQYSGLVNGLEMPGHSEQVFSLVRPSVKIQTSLPFGLSGGKLSGQFCLLVKLSVNILID